MGVTDHTVLFQGRLAVVPGSVKPSQGDVIKYVAGNGKASSLHTFRALVWIFKRVGPTLNSQSLLFHPRHPPPTPHCCVLQSSNGRRWWMRLLEGED